MKTEYRYQVGEVVNETLEIVSQTRHEKQNRKAYEVQSLVYPDAPTYIIQERGLDAGNGCAYKSGVRVYEGNSLYTLEWVRPYLVDIEEAKTLTCKSSKSIKLECPDCKNIQRYTVYNLSNRGFKCSKCSIKVSYSERLFLAYLEVKGIKYEYQKVFKDLPNRKFDFFIYLGKKNIIVETDGIQHKEDNGFWDYNKTKKSDLEKDIYCKRKGIELIRLDCSSNIFDNIVSRINDTILPITQVDKEKMLVLMSKEMKYPIQDIISLYKKGNNTKKIGEIFNISHVTVGNLLRKYDINLRNPGYSQAMCVMCTNTGKVFRSISEASRYYKTSNSNIQKVCIGKRKSAGTLNGEPLQWEYVEEEK